MSLRATQLRQHAGDRALLDDVSLSVEPGRVTAVLGPNGAGKSTLLKLLCGDGQPQAGTLTLDERPLSTWRSDELARRRAVVGQHDRLDFAFTVEDVVALGRLPHRGESPQWRHRLVHQALQSLDVQHLATRRYPTLSGGERARVRLARAMVQIWEPSTSHPRYLLLDEPTANLDLAHQHRCLHAIRDFSRQGVGVLVVLHDPNLVLDYADEVLVLSQGRTVALGPPADVLQAALLQQVYGIAVQVLPGVGPGRHWIQVRTDTLASPPA